MMSVAPTETGASIAPDVLELLRQLSVALHRTRAYPPGHPTLEGTVEVTFGKLQALLRTRESLAIGVSRHQLIIDEIETDPTNSIYAELAERLYRRQIGAWVISRGVSPESLRVALVLLGKDVRSSQNATSLGLDDAGLGEYISFLPFDFAPLHLAEGDESEEFVPTDRLLLDLARVLIGGDLGSGGRMGPSEVTPESVARVINERVREGSYESKMTAEFLRYAKRVREVGGAESIELRRQLRSLVGGLTPEAVATMLDGDGTADSQRRTLRTAMDALPTELVVDMIRAAAGAREQSISHSLIRLLRKLSERASPASGAAPAPEVDALLRETVKELVDDWTLADPNPPMHTHVLNRLAKRTPPISLAPPNADGEAIRVLQTSFETASTGDLVLEAVEDAIGDRRLGELLTLMAGYPASYPTSEYVWAYLVTPPALRRMLLEEPVEHDPAAAVLERVPAVDADVIIDALLISETQATRQLLLARLQSYGSLIADRIVRRLPEAPWYLLRNLLSLLAELPDRPADFSPAPFAAHAEPLVRREAIRLMLRDPAERDQGLLLALSDTDERVLRFGIKRTLGQPPRQVVPRLMRWVAHPGGDQELKAEAIALLGTLETTSVRDWLLERTVVTGGLFRTRRLAPRSPQLLASLAALAAHWRQDPRCAEAFRLAGRSDDPSIRQLVHQEPVA